MYKKNNVIAFLIVLMSTTSLFSQTLNIVGPTTATQGNTSHFSLTYPNGNSSFSYTYWYVDQGMIVGAPDYNSISNVLAIDILWDTDGIQDIGVQFTDPFYNEYYDNHSVTVSPGITPPSTPSAPVTPGTPIVLDSGCGQITLPILQRSGTPPVGDTWYWQGQVYDGTSTTLGSGATFTANQGSGNYYIRAVNSNGVWSSTSSNVYVNVITPTIWYADVDLDGFGDPNAPSISSCTQPTAYYVTNNLDQCPTQSGSNNGCPTYSLSNENYIYTIVPKIPVTDIAQITQNGDKTESVTYFDGLGRPMQSIGIRAGGINSEDIVTHVGYDEFGRQSKEYLPYAIASENGSYKTGDIELVTKNFYNTSKYDYTTNPFSEKQFEASPLNRVLKQAAPGNDWSLSSNHTIKMDYQASSSADMIKLYQVTAVWDASKGLYTPTLTQTTTYGAGELYKTVTKDENWTATDGNNKTTEEFKDKEGRVVLKRTYNNNTAHDTYYVYDDYGNLTYVLPPKAVDIINPTNLQTTITSTAVVTSGNSLSLAATNSITLTTGFNAQAGSTFTATILNNGIDNATILNELCYQYKYDYRNRLVEKKLPGKDWEYIVYDKLDRPILTQDANLRTANKWMFTKYDVFNRPVYTGEYVNTSTTTRALMQTLANGGTTLYETKQGANTINGSTVYYSNNAFPTGIDVNTSVNLFTINYYDDYSFDLNGGVTETAYTITPITNAKSLATGSKVRILGTTSWTTNVIYYDTKGRPIYNYSKNDYLATTNKVKSNLDFVGKTLETTTTHTRGAATTTIVDAFVFDKTGRLLTQKQKINAQAEEVIVSNTYDELGQLISKGVGGKSTQGRLQTVDYTYNVRGWLKGINNVTGANNTINLGTGDLFGFQMNYNNPTDPLTALFNGNISQTLWKTTSVNTTANPVSNTYTYNYDALNRLTSGIDNTTNYNESLSYDKNGNIKSIVRKGNTDANATIFGTMDNLAYTYDVGNKLLKVEDSSGSTEGFTNGTSGASTDYTYDFNGNMKTDLNKGISSVSYNYLNLPTQVVLAGGTVSYVYDATGAKQQKIVNGITTDYAGGFIYENSVMKFFSQPEGYVANNGGTFSYIYQYKDHLGNVRLSYGDGNNDGVVNTSEIVEENNYYPFGLKQKGYNVGFVIGSGNATAQKYKYQGQERQDELGLNWDSFKWRNYDYAIGRFMSVDPLAPDFPQWSPYVFSGNLVTVSKELEGMEPTFMIGPDGKLTTGMVSLLNAAYGYSSSSLQNSVWVSGLDNRVADAITLGSHVFYTDKLKPAKNDYWLGLIAHEQSHRDEVDENIVGFYAEDIIQGMTFTPYKKIKTEARAFINGSDDDEDKLDYADQLATYNEGEVMSIFKNGGLTNNEKASMLQGVGARFRRDVILKDRISSSKSKLSNLRKEMAKLGKIGAGTQKFFNRYINHYNKVIDDSTDEQDEITNTYGH